jgi:hypothetical protein
MTMATETDPAVVERLQAERTELQRRLAEIDAAILAERFRGVPRLSEGDLVLVPRKLFGQVRWWPAKISHVHLDYTSGTNAHGQRWESHRVSYGVYLRQKDGAFGGSTNGYWAGEVQPIPQQEES